MAAKSPPDESGRERLLAAGLAEFAERGPDGARVDSISRRSGVNKQLIYYYFGDKDGLYREVLRWCFGQPGRALPEGDIEDLLVAFFREVAEDPTWLRLLQWEALGAEPADDDVRRGRFTSIVAMLREAQAGGAVADDVPAEHLALVLVAAAQFPHSFPQLTEMIAGSAPTTAAFADGYAESLRTIGKILLSKPNKGRRRA